MTGFMSGGSVLVKVIATAVQKSEAAKLEAEIAILALGETLLSWAKTWSFVQELSNARRELSEQRRAKTEAVKEAVIGERVRNIKTLSEAVEIVNRTAGTSANPESVEEANAHLLSLLKRLSYHGGSIAVDPADVNSTGFSQTITVGTAGTFSSVIAELDSPKMATEEREKDAASD